MTIPDLMESYPNHMKLVGFIATEWAQVEAGLSGLLDDILGRPGMGMTIYNTLGSFKARSDLLLSFVHQIENPLLQKDLLKALDKIGDVAAKRNDLFHACWGFSLGDSDPEILIQRPARAKNKIVRRRVTVKELSALAAEMPKRLADLHTLVLYWTSLSDPHAAERITLLRQQHPSLDAWLNKYE